MRAVPVLAVTSLCCGVLSFSSGEDAAQFHPPVQLIAGETPMGQGILYPSPELHDLDGDGRGEMLIGDLRGQLLFARRTSTGSATEWSELEPVTTADGEPIKFDNW